MIHLESQSSRWAVTMFPLRTRTGCLLAAQPEDTVASEDTKIGMETMQGINNTENIMNQGSTREEQTSPDKNMLELKNKGLNSHQQIRKLKQNLKNQGKSRLKYHSKSPKQRRERRKRKRLTIKSHQQPKSKSTQTTSHSDSVEISATDRS